MSFLKCTILVLCLGIVLRVYITTPNTLFYLTDFDKWEKYRLPQYGHFHSQDKLIATFLGTSSILFSDGEDAILLDGFFTRTTEGKEGALWMILNALFPWSSVSSNHTAIVNTLNRLELLQNSVRLAAVPVVHSHHDHAMDSGYICSLTGCTVIGSNTTANIARASGLSEKNLEIIPYNSQSVGPFSFGKFKITMIRSRHVPLPLVSSIILNTTIDHPITPPIHILDYKEGATYSVFVDHPWGSALVQASANSVPHALDKVHAKYVFLAITGLQSQNSTYREQYYSNVVSAVHPSFVVPIHFDDFTYPLESPMVAMPSFPYEIEWLQETVQKEGKAKFGWWKIWDSIVIGEKSM